MSKPRRETLHRRIRIPADVVGHNDATIHARASGYVKEIPVDIGSRVKEGDRLVLLDAPELDAAVTAAEAVALEAAAAVREARASSEATR
ncbi:MAG: biotin/lipoyl-binding protein, partial [Planctomycetota bacterium]